MCPIIAFQLQRGRERLVDIPYLLALPLQLSSAGHASPGWREMLSSQVGLTTNPTDVHGTGNVDQVRSESSTRWKEEEEGRVAGIGKRESVLWDQSRALTGPNSRKTTYQASIGCDGDGDLCISSNVIYLGCDAHLPFVSEMYLAPLHPKIW